MYALKVKCISETVRIKEFVKVWLSATVIQQSYLMKLLNIAFFFHTHYRNNIFRASTPKNSHYIGKLPWHISEKKMQI